MSDKPSVLFVCVHNAGKSQTAAALMRHIAGDAIEVHSAGTDPDEKLSAGAVAALAELGISTGAEHPKAIDAELLSQVDCVIILGSDAQIVAGPDIAARTERWVIPAETDTTLSGADRARAVRDDIAARIRGLAAHLTA